MLLPSFWKNGPVSQACLLATPSKYVNPVSQACLLACFFVIIFKTVEPEAIFFQNDMLWKTWQQHLRSPSIIGLKRVFSTHFVNHLFFSSHAWLCRMLASGPLSFVVFDFQAYANCKVFAICAWIREEGLCPVLIFWFFEKERKIEKRMRYARTGWPKDGKKKSPD